MMPRDPESERVRLRRELAESRRKLSGDVVDLGHAVDVRERLRGSVRRHPEWWIGGGLIGGLILANLLQRPQSKSGGKKDDLPAPVKSSLFLGLLGIAGKQILRLSEPALKRYAQQEIDRWAQSRGADNGQDRNADPRSQDS